MLGDRLQTPLTMGIRMNAEARDMMLSTATTLSWL